MTDPVSPPRPAGMVLAVTAAAMTALALWAAHRRRPVLGFEAGTLGAASLGAGVLSLGVRWLPTDPGGALGPADAARLGQAGVLFLGLALVLGRLSWRAAPAAGLTRAWADPALFSLAACVAGVAALLGTVGAPAADGGPGVPHAALGRLAWCGGICVALWVNSLYWGWLLRAKPAWPAPGVYVGGGCAAIAVILGNVVALCVAAGRAGGMTAG